MKNTVTKIKKRYRSNLKIEYPTPTNSAVANNLKNFLMLS